MNLQDIRAPKGARKDRKRIGRGHASGWGKTAGKGHKGQNARSGGGVRPGFEGGQMPYYRRIPKFGFTNIFRKEFAEVKLSDLGKIEADVIDSSILVEAGIARSGLDGVKIIGTGEIEKAVTLRVQKVTKGARKKIEEAGGTIELIDPETPIYHVDVAKAARKIQAGVIDEEQLRKVGLIPEEVKRFKLVKRGILKDARTFRVAEISASARRAIKVTGGKIEEIG